MSEEWRDVVGWEGFYQVSDLGSVRSLDRHVPARNNQGIMSTRFYASRVLKQKTTSFGYRAVALCRDSEMHHIFVHRLVCEAFHGDRPSEEHEVAHGNAVRTDNRASNLRWATKLENGADKVAHGNSLTGTSHPNAKLTDAAVMEIIATKGMKRSGERTRSLARKFGVSVATVASVRQNAKRWKHLRGGV